MATNSAQQVYNESAPARFPMNMRTASEDLGISQQKLSRIVKFLQVPVIRHGYSLLLDSASYVRVKKALNEGVIKRGRRKKMD